MPPVLDRLHDERDRLLAAVDEITNAAEGADRDLSSAELELIARHRSRVDDELDPQIDQLEQIEVSRTRHVRAAAGLPPALPAPNGAPASNGDDEVVYRTFAEYARDELVRRYDAIAQRVGPGARAAAEERLARAVAHTLTANVPGLLPAQYLANIVAVIDSSRPIVESANRVGLTAGVLQYPNVTQRPTVGKQTAEKTELPSAAMNVAIVNVTADTYGGAGNLSWQAINWSSPDALALWFDLVAGEYARQTEAAAGTVLAALAAGGAVGSNDLAGWLAAITAAAGKIYAASRMRPDTIWADVTRGYALIGQVSTAQPVFLTAGGFDLSTGAGNVAGLRLVISPGLPANTVVVGASRALLAAETPGAPVELRAVEPSIAGMEVGVVGAFVAKVTNTAAFEKLTMPA